AGPPAPGRTRGGPARHPATGYRARAVRRSCQHWRAGRSRAGCRARVGPAARTPGADGGGDPTSRAPDSHLSRERGGARGATRAGTGEGGDSAVMKRREFLTTLRRYVATTVSVPLISVVPSYRRTVVASLLIPMDDAQGDHLKAYGVTYRVVQAGIKAEWLLNYRGGSFLLPDGPAIRRDAALAGVSVEPVEEAHVTAIRGEIEASNMDAVPLEKAPKVAVYVPPNAPPWDDAVTMALQYAGIPFDTVWDFEVMAGKLANYDWVHLPHDEFTGQDSKLFLVEGPGVHRGGRRAQPGGGELLRHRWPPGERRAASPAARRVQAVQLQRQDRPCPHDAGAESSPGDPRFLRAHHVVSAEPPEAKCVGAGRRRGRGVGEVHPRGSRQGNVDLLRRARSGRSAAPDR